jgi:hypothetical protein
VGGGGELAGLGRKRPSGLGFKRGQHEENEGAMGNASRGSGWQDEGRSGLPTGRRGEAATASNCRDGKGRRRGEVGRRGSLPQGETPAVARGDRGAARRRGVGRPRCGGGKLGTARVCEVKGDGCGLTRGQRHGCGTLNWSLGEASTRGLRVPRGEGGVPQLDSGSNPSLARGQGWTRWAGQSGGEGERVRRGGGGLGRWAGKEGGETAGWLGRARGRRGRRGWAGWVK